MCVLLLLRELLSGEGFEASTLPWLQVACHWVLHVPGLSRAARMERMTC